MAARRKRKHAATVELDPERATTISFKLDGIDINTFADQPHSERFPAYVKDALREMKDEDESLTFSDIQLDRLCFRVIVRPGCMVGLKEGCVLVTVGLTLPGCPFRDLLAISDAVAAQAKVEGSPLHESLKDSLGGGRVYLDHTYEMYPAWQRTLDLLFATASESARQLLRDTLQAAPLPAKDHEQTLVELWQYVAKKQRILILASAMKTAIIKHQLSMAFGTWQRQAEVGGGAPVPQHAVPKKRWLQRAYEGTRQAEIGGTRDGE